MTILNVRLSRTSLIVSCSIALFSQLAFAGGGGGCSYISLPVVDWTATSGSITIACGNSIPSDSAPSIYVHSGATLDSLINNGALGFAASGPSNNVHEGILNYGTIGSISNNNIINIIVNHGTIGAGGIAINNGALWGVTNYGVINGNVVLQTGTTTDFKIYGSSARIIGDVVISNPSPTSGSTLTIGDGSQTASFTSEGNFGAANYKLSSLSVGSGSTFNLNKSVYADTFTNAGTLNLNTGAQIFTDVVGAGAVNVNGTFDSSGTFSASNFTIGTAGIFNMNDDVTISSGSFTNQGNLVISSNRTITGNYNQAATGVIQIALNGTSFSQLSITGTATFAAYSGASIIIKPGSDPIAGHTYNAILSAGTLSGITGSVSGTFVENPSETYHYTITQNGSSLNMFVDIGPLPAVNSVDPPRANQVNSLIQLAMITTQAVRDRLNWMSGAAYKGTTADNRVWMTPYTSWGTQKDNLGAYKQKINGLIMGADQSVTDDFYIGGSVAIGGSALKGTDAIPHENFSAKNYQAIIYSKYSFSDSFHLKSYLMGGVNKSDLSRFDVTEGKDANARLTGYYAGGSVSLEKEFQVAEKQKLIPTVGLNYVSALVDHYQDSLNSTYDKQTAKSLVYSAGAMYQYSFDANDRLQLKYELGYDPLAKQAILNSTNDDHQKFQLLGITPGKQLENAGVNYHRTLKANSFLDFDYHLMKSNNYKAEMVSASFHYMF